MSQRQLARSRSAQRSRLLASAVLGLLLSACEGSGHGNGGGSVSPPGPEYFYELEPNDTPQFPDFIANLDPYSELLVEGHLEGGPSSFYDIYDHFEFVATTPTEFFFELHTDAPFADLAIGVYDPYFGEIVLWWDTPYSGESGSFVVHEPGKVFQLVIFAPSLGTDYGLELSGFPYPFGLESDSDSPADGAPSTQEQLAQEPAITAGTQGPAPSREGPPSRIEN
ncbi:MAG: hypothetical protein ACI9HE_001839 [Planctomycetota bacterium]|jgi:hypothetical protein